VKTIAFRRVGRAYIVVQGATTASNYEWNEYANDLHANIDHIDVMIVWTAGGTPNAEQRAYQAALWAKTQKRPRVAILTPSAFVNSFVSSLAWVARQRLRAFGPDDLVLASGYLDLSEEERNAVAEEIARLRKTLG
jgi:hypothetical protein